ncbi:uncharacterized protein [Epargyreus clarus]|uniref:uncharacterized protein n=1 Tax=Epargyreus clarus TaxID=520877 RepID=UPI003C2BC057
MSVLVGFVKIVCFLVLFAETGAISENCTSEVGDKNAILSRRKRFIVFPEGSSFQLVFCLTYPALIGIGDIFLWGNTAALAFELPQDPYSPFNHRADPLHRRVDTKVIYYTDEDGRIVHKTPYKRKPFINPAFAKRSVDLHQKAESSKLDRKQMHASSTRDYLQGEHMQGSAVEFHRNSRVELYQKVETMLEGFGADGRQCLLKTLCLVGQAHKGPQGEFLHELLRAVFTLPKNKEIDDDYYKEFDEASKATSCEELYPDCNTPLRDVQ